MDDILGFLAILAVAALALFLALAALHIIVFLGLLVLVILLPGVVRGLLEKPPDDV